eukprot:scaffold1474_cov153-Skeletonema_marinoi.AAC.1
MGAIIKIKYITMDSTRATQRMVPHATLVEYEDASMNSPPFQLCYPKWAAQTHRLQSSAGYVDTVGQLQSLHLIDGIDALQYSLDILIFEHYR